MPGWMWFLPLIALGLAGGVIAFMMGNRMSNSTETEVIERIAAAYVEQSAGAGSRTDCRAIPAQSQGLWLVVICERASGAGAEYFIDHFGRVADSKPLEGRR